MSDVITALKDAPVMNLFVIVGALLVIFAAVGRVFTGPSGSNKMDLGGRILLGGCGFAMLAAATVMFLGLRAAASRPAVDQTATSGGPKPTPVTRGIDSGQTRVLTSPEIRVAWGCGESRPATLSLPLPDGTRFLAAEFEILEIDKAKSYVRNGPALDAGGHAVTGEVIFQGLDKVFLNCPGGGHARLQMKVTVAESSPLEPKPPG